MKKIARSKKLLKWQHKNFQTEWQEVKVVKKFKPLRVALVCTLTLCLASPKEARADLFGGDVAVLTQILANAIQQLYQLKQILSTGADTLGLLRDINRGLRDGLGVIQILNPRFNPGLYGDLETADRVLSTIEDLYGKVPQTGDARLQAAQDQSVAESIAMNGRLFRFADEADATSRQMIDHSRLVNPQGAAKLTAQSVAVLIQTTTQLLRTNSMMMKLMAENLAVQNRKEKIESAQFRSQYDGLSEAFSGLPQKTKLPTFNGE